jgi:hypothetical protein
MTFKIEKKSDGPTTTIRLVGQIEAEHLEAVKAEIDSGGPGTMLDLEETTLVDVDVVRFLGRCEAHGIQVLHGAPYIREWMLREKTSRDK